MTLLIALARSVPGDGHRRLEELGELEVAGEHRRIVRSESEVGHESAALRVRELGKSLADLVDERISELEWHHVGLGEVAVVVRLLLAAKRAGHLSRDVVVAGLLDDLAAALDEFDLADDLVRETVVHRLEAVHVLDLGLGAQLGLATLAYAHVRVDPHGPLLHRAVADAERQPDEPELLGEAASLLRSPDVRLADQLDQRGAGAIEVHQRLGRTRDPPFAPADVDHLAGVLFQVNARDTDPRDVAIALAVAKRRDALRRLAQVDVARQPAVRRSRR